jgi:hypothetical protein
MKEITMFDLLVEEITQIPKYLKRAMEACGMYSAIVIASLPESNFDEIEQAGKKIWYVT